MPLNQQEHGDISWWDASAGWREITEDAYAKYVFANKSNRLIPYGSYVFGEGGYRGLPVDTLRVEKEEYVVKLNEHFKIVKDVILEGKSK
jgi:hypothetical protein